MSSVQVYEICKVCNRPSKARIEFFGKVEIVDLMCDCDIAMKEPKKKNDVNTGYQRRSRPVHRLYD